jgi:hypothetical protein
MTEDEHVQNTLISIFQIASEHALISTIEELASACGIHTLKDLPVMQYFQETKQRHAEHLVADFADMNPSFATSMKQAWDTMSDSESEQ